MTETLAKVDESGQEIVAYMANGDAVGPSDFAGGEEEMHFLANQDGWEPLVRATGITVKGDSDEANADAS